MVAISGAGYMRKGMSNILELDNITIEFQVRRAFRKSISVKAVDGVSLILAEEETLGVVGESGSGKTTLGRLSLLLERPTNGRVLFRGNDITDESESHLKEFRRKAQVIFQDPFATLDPYMNIGQILEEPLLIHHLGTPEERIKLTRQALTEVKLDPPKDFIHRFPHILSGGQRQRLAVARALILRPDYIVADEPVSMIDASNRAEILFLFKELQAKHNISFLYITHDIATAHYFCQRIAVMYLGQVVELGSAFEVVNNPLHPYTRSLIAAVPSPDPKNRFKERDVAGGTPPSPTNVPRGCRFHPRCTMVIKGKCEVIEPKLKVVNTGNTVACHLY
jgi:peptide/nickel transport system ATP-binding protein